MAESLQTSSLRTDLEVECPGCEYPMWIRMSEVVVQTTVRCPCCRVEVRLIDERASAANLGVDLDSAIDQAFSDLFKGL